MALTDPGERFLVENWKIGLDAKREVESVLRSVTVALWMDDVGTAAGLLFASSSERERQLHPTGSEPIVSGKAPLDIYATIKSFYESQRLFMEVKVLRCLGERLVGRPLEPSLKPVIGSR
jgi:hypothetical protein